VKENAMKRWICSVLLLAMVAVASPAGAQSSERCFPETGQCISGRLREFWEQNGGLPVFGFPKSPQQLISVEGKQVEGQLFERNRLELHPENARPYDVLLGRLGADRLAQLGHDSFTFATSEPQPGCRYFSETRHNVCGGILAAWRAHGLEFDGKRGTSEAESLALFGLPLSELQSETIDGVTLQVQWFERARFELHPENAAPYNVLLGLLGNEVGAPQPPAAPPDAHRPLPPPTFNACQQDPAPEAAPDYPVRIVAVDKQAETVTLRNESGEAVDLGGWHMCSIRGNQEHPIGGALAPGESKVFNGPPGTIWNNGDQDDGSLYNGQGQLVSYWHDR
jgi:hypothetical protein